MSEIKRWDIWRSECGKVVIPPKCVDKPDGPYVLYSDHQQTLADKGAEITLKEKELIATRELIGGYVDRIEELEAWKEAVMATMAKIDVTEICAATDTCFCGMSSECNALACFDRYISQKAKEATPC